MENFLGFLAAVLMVAVVIVMFNEKVTKQTNEIALLIVSLIIGVVISIFNSKGNLPLGDRVMEAIETFRLILYVTYITIIFTTVIQGLTVDNVYNFVNRKWPVKVPEPEEEVQEAVEE